MKYNYLNIIFFLKKIINKLLRLFFLKLYGNINTLRSECDDGIYLSFVHDAINSKKVFSNFRKHPVYQNVLDHTNYDFGLKYLEIVKRDNPQFIDKIDLALENDQVGSPNIFYYKDINRHCCPATLRYLKIASDLKKLFGDEFSTYLEIGCGYGGQALINDRYFKINKIMLIDLLDVTFLVKKYLECFLLNSNYETFTYNTCPKNIKDIDLFVSNYAFSEFSIEVQKKYLSEIICKSKRGYMIMNSGRSNTVFGDKNHLKVEEIKKYLPNLKIIDEEPLTFKGNYIISWDNK